MPRRIAGTEPRVVSQRREPGSVIDVQRHRAGLHDAAETVCTLVERLTRGMAILQAMPMDDPQRPDGEMQWRELIVRLHTALRDAYARWALLRIALPHEEAMALWNECLPSADALQAIGAPEMIRYWKSRTAPPEWITHQEAQFITHSLWPPTGTDPVTRGLLDTYEPPPF